MDGFAQSSEDVWFREAMRSRRSEYKPEESIAAIANEIRTPEEYHKLKAVLASAAARKDTGDTTEYAIRVAGRLKKADASEILKSFVNSDSFAIRSATYQSLAEVGDEQALTLLEKRLGIVEKNTFSGAVSEQDDAMNVLRCIAFIGGNKAKKIYFDAAERTLHQLDSQPERKQEMKDQFEELWKLMRENDAKRK